MTAVDHPVQGSASELTELIAGLGSDVAERLLRAHVPDPLGYCRACSLPQGGPQSWPCTLHSIAAAAAVECATAAPDAP